MSEKKEGNSVFEGLHCRHGEPKLERRGDVRFGLSVSTFGEWGECGIEVIRRHGHCA